MTGKQSFRTSKDVLSKGDFKQFLPEKIQSTEK